MPKGRMQYSDDILKLNFERIFREAKFLFR